MYVDIRHVFFNGVQVLIAPTSRDGFRIQSRPQTFLRITETSEATKKELGYLLQVCSLPPASHRPRIAV